MILPRSETNFSAPHSLPTSAPFLIFTFPAPGEAPGTSTRAGPPLGSPLAMRTLLAPFRLLMIVSPGEKRRRPALKTLMAPYVPAGRSHSPFPGLLSGAPMQSAPASTVTGDPGSHGGSGRTTPQATATSP